MLLRRLSGCSRGWGVGVVVVRGRELVLGLVWSPLVTVLHGSSDFTLQTPVSSQCHGQHSLSHQEEQKKKPHPRQQLAQSLCVGGTQRGFLPPPLFLPRDLRGLSCQTECVSGRKGRTNASRFVAIGRGQLLALALREPLRGGMGCGRLPSHSEQTVGCCAWEHELGTS